MISWLLLLPALAVGFFFGATTVFFVAGWNKNRGKDLEDEFK